MQGMRGAQGPPDPEKAFNKIDADGDGILNATEMKTMTDMMSDKMGTETPSSEDLMSKLDMDGDGALSFAEFEAGRSQGMQRGSMGGGQGMRVGQRQQMDLSSLFASSDEETESESYLESLLAYA